MPVRSPALAAMAIDDIAQGSVHDILDATAQAAAAVSLAHGLCPIRRGILSITALVRHKGHNLLNYTIVTQIPNLRVAGSNPAGVTNAALPLSHEKSPLI